MAVRNRNRTFARMGVESWEGHWVPGLSEPPTPGSRGATCMLCNQPIVISIAQSRWQSCSSATFVKVG
eukprot:2925105-Prymnesium_polylepis.1